MADPATSIELARKYSKYGNSFRRFARSKQAAVAILMDCLDRRGVKWEFERVDPETIDSIIDDWAEIIKIMMVDA
jgi:hypothetical protein